MFLISIGPVWPLEIEHRLEQTNAALAELALESVATATMPCRFHMDPVRALDGSVLSSFGSIGWSALDGHMGPTPTHCPGTAIPENSPLVGPEHSDGNPSPLRCSADPALPAGLVWCWIRRPAASRVLHQLGTGD